MHISIPVLVLNKNYRDDFTDKVINDITFEDIQELAAKELDGDYGDFYLIGNDKIVEDINKIENNKSWLTFTDKDKYKVKVNGSIYKELIKNLNENKKNTSIYNLTSLTYDIKQLIGFVELYRYGNIYDFIPIFSTKINIRARYRLIGFVDIHI